MQRRTQVASTSQPTPLALLLQVRAGPASQPHGRQSSASSNVTHISPYLPHPAPSSQPRLQLGLLLVLLEGREGLPSPAGQATSESLRRRHSPAAVLIGSTRDPAVHCNPSHLPYAGSGAVVTSPARDTHTHTPQSTKARAPTVTTPPCSPHRASMPSRSRAQHNAGTRYQTGPVPETAFLHRKGRQAVTALVWLLPWFHRASSAAG